MDKSAEPRKSHIDAKEALGIGLALLKVAGDVPMLADGATPAEINKILADLDAVRQRIIDARKD